VLDKRLFSTLAPQGRSVEKAFLTHNLPSNGFTIGLKLLLNSLKLLFLLDRELTAQFVLVNPKRDLTLFTVKLSN
jgi:hypothetical protein